MNLAVARTVNIWKETVEPMMIKKEKNLYMNLLWIVFYIQKKGPLKSLLRDPRRPPCKEKTRRLFNLQNSSEGLLCIEDLWWCSIYRRGKLGRVFEKFLCGLDLKERVFNDTNAARCFFFFSKVFSVHKRRFTGPSNVDNITFPRSSLHMLSSIIHT